MQSQLCSHFNGEHAMVSTLLGCLKLWKYYCLAHDKKGNAGAPG
jgi:hypothetical protein